MPFNFHEAFLKLPDDIVREHIYKPLLAENFPVIKSIQISRHVIFCPYPHVPPSNTCKNCSIHYYYEWLNHPPGTGWGRLKFKNGNENINHPSATGWRRLKLKNENITKREFRIF